MKWIARLRGDKDSDVPETVLNVHKCTKEDFEQFYPLDADYENDFDSFKDSL